jgi:hypothetical protein
VNWEAAGAIGEIVGALGVIVTLGYLARQIRENSRQMKVSSIIAINQLMNEAFDPIYNNDRTIRIWMQGQVSPQELSAEDEAVFSLFMSRLVNVCLTAFSQRRFGTLGEEEFRPYAGMLKSLLETPGGIAWLEHMGGSDLLNNETKETLKASDLHLHGVIHRDARSAAFK